MSWCLGCYNGELVVFSVYIQYIIFIDIYVHYYLDDLVFFTLFVSWCKYFILPFPVDTVLTLLI